MLKLIVQLALWISDGHIDIALGEETLQVGPFPIGHDVTTPECTHDWNVSFHNQCDLAHSNIFQRGNHPLFERVPIADVGSDMGEPMYGLTAFLRGFSMVRALLENLLMSFIAVVFVRMVNDGHCLDVGESETDHWTEIEDLEGSGRAEAN